MSDALQNFLSSSVRTATPLLLAALGEVVVERAGIINIGLEGLVIGGAFGALVGASHGGAALGLAGAVVSGVLLALLFQLVVDVMSTDQIIAGTAITILGLGLTGALYTLWYGAAGAALSIPTFKPVAVPVLSGIPVFGEAFFDQTALTYLCYLLVPAIWWWMYRTHAGLSLRAIGESPRAAISSGIPVRRFRLFAIIVGGALGGLAGGTLVVAQAGTFAENMSAGRGFIAIAVVVLGRWNPIGVAVASLVFGAATAVQYLLQAIQLSVPYQLVLALPYLLTLAALAGVAGKVKPPAWLGKPLSS
jgi:simple sugar transport system permease protein